MDRSEGGTKGDEAVTVVIGDDATTDDRATGSTRPAEIEERRYVVVETLGRGGMGTVVRAYDPRLRREVALKQLRADVLDPHLAGVQKQLGLMLHDQERYDEALGPLQDSLATHESTGDVERDDTVDLHLAIARTLEALERDDEALERYERCWDIAQRVELTDHSRASVTFHRHRARWEAQIDRPGAVEAIRAVRAGLGEADAKRPLGAELDAWIGEHD